MLESIQVSLPITALFPLIYTAIPIVYICISELINCPSTDIASEHPVNSILRQPSDTYIVKVESPGFFSELGFGSPYDRDKSEESVDKIYNEWMAKKTPKSVMRRLQTSRCEIWNFRPCHRV